VLIEGVVVKEVDLLDGGLRHKIQHVAEHFAGGDGNNQRTAEEILASALTETPDEKLTSFALRIALTGCVAIPPEGELDFLAEAATAFVPPQPPKEKKAKKTPTPIKAAMKKKVAA